MSLAFLTLPLLALSAEPALGRVSAQEVPIHAEPSGRSPMIGFAHLGAALALRGCVPDCEPGTVRWYLLEPRGAVRAARISVTATAAELPPEPEGYLYAVILAELALRQWPSEGAPEVGQMKARRSVALVPDGDAPEGWYRHLGGGWLPASGLRINHPSQFEGEPDPVLPVAFLPDAVRLGTRANRVLLHKQTRFGGAEVGDKQVTVGGWRLPRSQVRIAFGRRRPPGVPAGGKWIHVDLSEQVLTAYEGDRAVFATLVSTGKRGHETRPGQWRVWMKTRHDRMHGEDYDLEEVPWSQYFYDNQALHAAFWHDRFGHRLTHGCINLAPADARRLFEWTSPDVPEGWHSATAVEELPATTVLVEKRIAPRDRLPALQAPRYTRYAPATFDTCSAASSTARTACSVLESR